MSEGHNGIAYGSDITLRLSTWYEDDEKDSDDYIGDGNAAFIGWKPYFEEDIIVILTNEQFMGYLKEYASIYLKEQPGDKKQIDIYLKLIKNRLNL